jgi:ribosomal protein L37AE/L43A
MQAKYYPQKRNLSKKAHRHLKICVNCGNTEVEEYEFGISCELCGTSFYFGKTNFEEVNENGTNL